MGVPERVVSSERARELPLAALGGKARKLADLGAAGLPVPPWFAVTTAVFSEVAARVEGEIATALAGLDPTRVEDARAAATRIAAAFARAGLSPSDEKALLETFDATFPPGQARVAVRSSAVGEDSATDSFAGQMETFLCVERRDVAAKVLACFASAWSERALLYRKLRGLAARPELAVVVQLMVESRASGVLFTANPTTGDRREAVLSAGLGLGEGVVEDRVETDSWTVELATGEVRSRTVQPKRSRVVRSPGGGTVLEAVPEGERDRPALSDDEVRALVALARRSQEHQGSPQDVEWAVDPSGTTFLLQTRPITTLAPAGQLKVFDASNIVESYPGLSSPLTFSFARSAYEQTFRQSSRTLGVPEHVLVANHHVHAGLIALVEGRIYYDLLHFYRLFQLVPGFEGVLPAWEKALGLEPGVVTPPPPPTRWERIARIPIKARVVRRILWHFARLTANVEGFLAEFRAVQEGFRARKLEELDPHDLVLLYEDLARRLLGPYSISVVNDFLAQQLYDRVGKLIAAWDLGEPGPLRNDLLCGETGMESVEPVRSLLRLAERVRGDLGLRRAFEDGRTDAAVWEALRADPPFREALDRHLSLYGDRTTQELKLETPLAEDDPAFLVSAIRNYLAGGQDVRAMEEREQRIRREAELAVHEKLRGRPLRGALFRFVLGQCRKTVRYRENLRLTRSRAFGMVKRIFRELGRRLVRAGVLTLGDDVFFLGVEEVCGAVRGQSVTRDLRALVAQRRAEYADFARRTPPHRVTVRGIVAGASFTAPRVSTSPEEGAVLQGIGCSPGRVTAPAKIVREPSGSLAIRGEVLVAPMTDPGWVFLMVAASGIVVERGSLLSHTAIIGRELGIPTVVGVRDATARLREGEPVELDGRAGTVRRVPG